MSIIWTLLSLLLICLQFQDNQANCVRSPSGQLYHFIPVRLFTPELLQNNAELVRQPRQQQNVQDITIINENNFGRPGFGLPPFGGGSFGGGPLGGGFRTRPFGQAGGFSGGFNAEFGGQFGSGFARSYEAEDQQEQVPQSPKQSPPVRKDVPNIPVPPCAQSYMISCEAVLKPSPCSTSEVTCGGY